MRSGPERAGGSVPPDDERAMRARAEREADARLERAAREAGPPGSGPPTGATERGPTREELLGGLQRAEQKLDAQRAHQESVGRELAEAEQRLSENQRRVDEALERASARLRELESRAAEAERRSERAERLADLRTEELERDRRLREMLDRIDAAERRASSAEESAREAVTRAVAPIAEEGAGTAPGDRTEGVTAATPRGEPRAADAAAAPEPAPGAAPGPEPVSINSASYEELRNLGLSVTQAGRLLAHREHGGGFGSLDELERLPGFPPEVLDRLRARVRFQR